MQDYIKLRNSDRYRSEEGEEGEAIPVTGREGP
jgi:hypothetical protein